MVVSSRQFTFNSNSNRFVAEVSDFGTGFRFDRIYPDACDVGILMMSERSGKVAKFVHVLDMKDGEGDFQGWVLQPTPETLRNFPQLRGVEVVIFND